MSGLPPTQPLNSRHPALRIARSAKEKQPKPKCRFCKRGFQFWRVPQLQIKCTECQNYVHLRYIKTVYDEEKFICQICSPSGVDSSVASPAPATVQSSLDERSDISPEQQDTEATANDNTQPLSGKHETIKYFNIFCFLKETPLSLASFPERRFRDRMNFLGFRRSPTQLNTPGDGSCFNWAVLDCHHNQQKENSKFPRDDPKMFRFEILIMNANYFCLFQDSCSHGVVDTYDDRRTWGD